MEGIKSPPAISISKRAALNDSTINLRDLGTPEHHEPSTSQTPSVPKEPHIFMFIETSGDVYLLIFGVIFCMATSVSPSLLSILFGRAFDKLAQYSQGNYRSFGAFNHDLRMACFAITGLGLGSCISVWFTISIWMMIGERQQIKARTRIFKAFFGKEMAWFDANKQLMGDLAQINRCVEELRAGTSEAAALLLQCVCSIIALTVTSLYYSWSLTLATLAGAPLIIGFGWYFSKLTEKYVTQDNTNASVASNIIDWNIGSAHQVRLFNAQAVEMDRFHVACLACTNSFLRLNLVMSSNLSCLRFFVLMMFVQGFWFGNTMVKAGKLTAGDVMTCFMSCLMIASTASGITEQLIHIQKARVAAVKIAKFLNTKKLLTTPSFNHGKLSLYPDQFLGNISFKNVSFAYPSRKHQIILKSVSLSFKANQTTFIVGVSGSSKSTLFQLLFGFYLPSAGRVDVDGFEVRNVNEGWLTDNITLVQQECILFNDTIRNNITMTSNGNDPETSDRFAEACKIALVNEMVEDFPDGLETNITAKGTSLSGGQRQRVALARAIFKNSSVLILDEAVSALDISLRRRVMFNIRKWRREKTTIITTHELDTISPDDYVYVMEDGKVCESGTSQSLELQRDSAFSWLRSRDREGARELEELPRENSVNPFSNAFRVEDNVYFEFSKPLNSRYSAVSHKFLLGFSESPSQHGYVSESSIDLCDHKILSYHTPISSEQEAVESYKLDTATRPYKRTVPSTKISTEVMGVIEILRFMMGHIRKKLHLVLGVICAVINGASNPVFSFAFSKLISGIITSDKDVMDAHFILKWSIIVIAICIVDSATTFGKSIFLGYAAEMWILECRKQSFDSISKQEVSWFSGANRNPAEISALLMNDTRDLRNLVSEFLSVIGSIFVLLTVGIIWALVTGWKLSLVGISLIPLFALCTMAYSGFLRFSEASYKVAVAELENQVHDTVDGIRTIKCLNMKRHFCHLFDTQRDALLRSGTNRAVHTGMGVAINSLITYLCQSILMYYGVRLVAMGTYTSGQMFLVFTLLVFSMTTAGSLMGQLPDISRGQRAGTYIVELLRLPPSDTETSGASDLFSIFQAPYPLLEFRDVTFAYPSNSDVLVLDGLNLQIHKGETVCIMGQSGSGKSTIASLMSKLYCPTAGSASWNGVPVTRLSAFWLRSQIAVVPQTATFFEGTLRDNLSYGLAELVSDAQYEESLKMANIYDFTVSLPQGLETRIGGSSNLLISGGQAQRLSIARALLRRPKILIMDECTSALDTENTQIIADLITNNLSIQKGLTTIVITHSESLMRASSRILTIKEGAVCESGSFQRLYNRRGEFFRIVASGRQ